MLEGSEQRMGTRPGGGHFLYGGGVVCRHEGLPICQWFDGEMEGSKQEVHPEKQAFEKEN